MRHRHGRTPPQPAVRDDLDSHQRAVADQLQASMPGWVVMWSYGKRAFTAYPCWSAPTGLVVTDNDPRRLLNAMRAAQTPQPLPVTTVTAEASGGPAVGGLARMP